MNLWRSGDFFGIVLLNSLYYSTNHNNCWLKMRSIPPVGRSVTVLQCVCRFRSRTERLMRLTCVSQTRPRQPRMIGPIFYKGRGQLKKKTFSFGHCPNYLTPPSPLTPIQATWSSFFGSRNSRFESQFRTKNTIYTI